MEQAINNPYRTPDAELVKIADASSALKLGRFSAWAVFGLTVITLGIYPLYWMYTHAITINTLHENKISTALLVSLVIATLLSFASNFMDQTQPEIIIAGGVIGIVYMVLYLVVLFKIRNRLQDILSQACGGSFRVGPVLTFFFFVIYLQYKINQCIDMISSTPVEADTSS
ncbi:MAG: DUF4234 domain-containing protein [Gammaproteobacteria bacterium]|nr:DUF4234 domain-containing protein [Gammaproteobacteria bacterium]